MASTPDVPTKESGALPEPGMVVKAKGAVNKDVLFYRLLGPRNRWDRRLVFIIS